MNAVLYDQALLVLWRQFTYQVGVGQLQFLYLFSKFRNFWLYIFFGANLLDFIGLGFQYLLPDYFHVCEDIFFGQTFRDFIRHRQYSLFKFLLFSDYLSPPRWIYNLGLLLFWLKFLILSTYKLIKRSSLLRVWSSQICDKVHDQAMFFLLCSIKLII